MAVWHLRRLDAQDLEGPHLGQKGALSPKRTHMPNGVFGAPPLPPPPPPIPTVAPICCTTITQKGAAVSAAVASAQRCFFKAVEWGVVGAQRGLAEACTSPDCTANALNSLSPIGACMQWHLKPWGPVARCTALGLRAQVAGRCNLLCNNQAKCSHLMSSPRMLDCSSIERRKEVPMYSH